MDIVLNNEDKMRKLKKLYGDTVQCKQGLYLFYDDKNRETYINPETHSLDNRAKYKTIKIYDNIIVAKVLTDPDLKYVILYKENLALLYKIDNCLTCVDDNLVGYVHSDELVIVSNTGRELYRASKAFSMSNIYKSQYLIRSKKMFNDSILFYDSCTDEIRILTEDRRYSIHQINTEKAIVDVTAMGGGKFEFDFKNKTCLNKFTGQFEEQTYLWNFS